MEQLLVLHREEVQPNQPGNRIIRAAGFQNEKKNRLKKQNSDVNNNKNNQMIIIVKTKITIRIRIIMAMVNIKNIN